MNNKKHLLILVIALIPLPVLSSSKPFEVCTEIVFEVERLACYDRLSAQNESRSLIEERKKLEAISHSNDFSLTPHRPNYILPISYNHSADFSRYGSFDEPFRAIEVQFQLSLKVKVLSDLWRNSSLNIGYTQKSFWQLYAGESASAPFRETNHEPELIWSIPINREFLGLSLKQSSLIVNHQSNGQIKPLSRSWNRIINSYIFEKDRFVFSFKWWWRIEEETKSDDNPNIEDYMGRLALGAGYIGQKHTIAIGLKNNAKRDNRSGVQLDWMFPLTSRIKGYIQVYSGYGENMIDQENYHNKIGVGIALTDWL